MPKLKYRLVVAQGFPAADAAAILDRMVNNLMEAGWEPSMPPGMLYGAGDGDPYVAFQAMLWNPVHNVLDVYNTQKEGVTAGGHQATDPVTPIIGKTICFDRDTPTWVDAWGALEKEITSAKLKDWMYMSSKLSNDGLFWTHSFKHHETRNYQTVTTQRIFGGG